MAVGRIVAYAAASAPSGWLLCDGTSYLRTAYPALFTAIGTTYGAADSTHFNVPDLRDRFALHKSASGTGSILGQSGGSLAHTHSGPSHTHSVTQPAAHSAHVVTQPTAHTSLTHSGFSVADHAAVSHSGASVAAHSVTHSDNHGSHSNAGSHDHDTHATTAIFRGSGSTGLINQSTKHSAAADHNHDAHSAHTESVSGHSVSSQGADHALVSHSITQAASHATITHSGITVDAHSAHTGMAAGSASAATSSAEPPYLVLTYIIATTTDQAPVGVVTPNASATVPADHLLCNGQSVLRASYPDLFALIGTTFGSVDGTHFNVPDMRGRHVIGKSAGSTIGQTGGAASHTHTGGAHTHTTTQASGHAAHVLTQADAHSLAHSGLAVADHASASHSGFAVSNHTVTQSSGHGTHTSDGAHRHDSHSFSGLNLSGSQFYGGPSQHSSDGGHTHDAHTAHSGAALDAHAETQAATHTAAAHTVVQPATHSISHSGAAIDAHSAHSGASIASGGASATSASDAPYLGLHYIIRTASSTRAIGTLFAIGAATAPANTLLCNGALVSRTTYASLFTAIGTTYGAGDGSTTFALPDLRGRFGRGVNGTTPALGGSGGALDHTHTAPAHTHSTTQPSAHSSHVVTQPAAHAVQAHSGADITNTHTLSHTGASIAAHVETQAATHTAHTSAGSHNHDAHSIAGDEGGGATISLMTSPTNHANEGSHTHTGAHSHSGFGVSAHSVTQANAHSRAHTSITQPADHTLSAHSGFAVDAHSAHSGFTTVSGGNVATGSANPPYLVVQYVIQALADVEAHTTTFAIRATGSVAITSVTKEELPVPNTPPSSPIILILEPPQ